MPWGEQDFCKLWERVGWSTRERFALRRDKVFGQKVGTEISCGMEDGKIFI